MAEAQNITGHAPVEDSSGNVFADIGLPEPDQHLAKAKLVIEIRRAIERLQLSPVEAASRLGLATAQVNDMLQGRFSKLSTSQILDCLNRLGRNVDIVVKDKDPHQQRAETRVLSA